MLQDVSLFWQNGYWVRCKIPIYDAKSHLYLGNLTTETPLIKFNEEYNNYKGLGESGEVVICRRNLNEAECFPTRFKKDMFKFPLRIDISLPIDSALRGEQGSTNSLGYHKHDVIAAYAPLANFGIGMLVQITTTEVYRPIQHQLQIILPVALLLIFCGLMLLYWQVVPLVRKVISSEQKLEKINSELATSVGQLHQRNQEITLLQEFSSELQS